jgi:hypothetical protein
MNNRRLLVSLLRPGLPARFNGAKGLLCCKDLERSTILHHKSRLNFLSSAICKSSIRLDNDCHLDYRCLCRDHQNVVLAVCPVTPVEVLNTLLMDTHDWSAELILEVQDSGHVLLADSTRVPKRNLKIFFLQKSSLDFQKL